MADEINLVPESVIKKHGQGKQYKYAIIAGVVAVVLAVAALFPFYFLARSLEIEVNSLSDSISGKKTAISKLKLTEDEETDFTYRIQAINKIISARKNESIFVNNLLKIVPPDIQISKISIDESDRVVTGGLAVSYGALADFLAVLSTDSKNKDSIFSSASLTEISLKKETGLISFTLEISVKQDSLLYETR